MKNIFKDTLIATIIGGLGYYIHNYATLLGIKPTSSEAILAYLTFALGAALTMLILDFAINKLNDSLNAYKRELEKTSIGSNESSSKVKVLESKIAVLEKALSDALNK